MQMAWQQQQQAAAQSRLMAGGDPFMGVPVQQRGSSLPAIPPNQQVGPPPPVHFLRSQCCGQQGRFCFPKNRRFLADLADFLSQPRIDETLSDHIVYPGIKAVIAKL